VLSLEPQAPARLERAIAFQVCWRRTGMRNAGGAACRGSDEPIQDFKRHKIEGLIIGGDETLRVQRTAAAARRTTGVDRIPRG
jgi:hypothetical protein